MDADGLPLAPCGRGTRAVLGQPQPRRAPLVKAASRAEASGWVSMTLISRNPCRDGEPLAANAAPVGNAQVIGRRCVLLGSTEQLYAQAFIRRFTLRALSGAAAGTGLGLAAILLLQHADAGAF